MLESEKGEVSIIQKAKEELGITPQEDKLINRYCGAILYFALSLINDPENLDKDLDFGDMKAYADEKYPEGRPLVEKIIERMT